MNLSIANVFTVSVSQPGAGAGEYNTSNIGLISHEKTNVSFPSSDPYKLYLEPSEVGLDFGTDSTTYKMAVAIFSQSPNILGPGGYLAIIKAITAVQSVSFSAGAPVSGGFKLNFGGGATSVINYNDNAAAIQTKLRLVAGLEKAEVTGSIPVGLSVKLHTFGVAALMTVSNNTMVDNTATPVVPTVAETTPGESLEDAINRSSSIVEYFGILATEVIDEAPLLAAAALVQTMNKLLFAVQIDDATVEPGGTLDQLRTGSLRQTRGLFYGGVKEDALKFAAAYASRGLSVDFDGNNTTITMHLKDLVGIQPDPSMSQTLLNKCQDAGVDVMVSIQGVTKVFTSGENMFFDRIYNQLWIVGRFQIDGFNLFAQTPTKIPQTEDGQLQLMSVLRKVCEQAVTNQYLAPGEWNSPTTFGSQEDLKSNIKQFGYYLYSAPLAKQSTAAREARQAAVVQAALKEAGANHSGSMIVNINA